jgi:hypothetical protein
VTSILSWLDDYFGPPRPVDETTELPQRPRIVFTGSGVTVTDDAPNKQTVVTVGGGLSTGTNTTTGSIALTSAGSFLSVGVAPSATGGIRLANAVKVKSRNADDSGDADLLWLDASNVACLGGTGVAAVIIQAPGTCGFYDGSFYSWICNYGGRNASSFPIHGLSVAWGSVNGVGVQAMADANQTPAAAVFERRIIRTTGALTATRTLTLPPVSDDGQAYEKIIDNQCTGAFSVVISVGAGTTVTVANARRAVILVDSSGVRRVSADQA